MLGKYILLSLNKFIHFHSFKVVDFKLHVIILFPFVTISIVRKFDWHPQSLNSSRLDLHWPKLGVINVHILMFLFFYSYKHNKLKMDLIWIRSTLSMKLFRFFIFIEKGKWIILHWEWTFSPEAHYSIGNFLVIVFLLEPQMH